MVMGSLRKWELNQIFPSYYFNPRQKGDKLFTIIFKQILQCGSQIFNKPRYVVEKESQRGESVPSSFIDKSRSLRNRKLKAANRNYISSMVLLWYMMFLVSVEACRMGELKCRDGTCLSPDKYCDGHFDCPGKDDEPRQCTPCGRLYYGIVGKTYSLEVNRPHDSRVPQECNLTFVAAGDSTGGDIVQLSILKFSLGKFHSHTSKGCPHGHMQIIEEQRLYRSGYWCGNGVGMELYYSETPSVTIILTMLPPDNDLTALDAYPSFYFLMSYKFLKHSSAVVRYGANKNVKFTGLRDRTTVCNVHFHSCDPIECYIQSPNFPGMYPRNTTCYYQLGHNDAIPGTRAVLVLEQKAAHLVHIKSSVQPHDTKTRKLKLYEDCFYVGDYVRIYDGNSTTSPVLITFCRGDVLPKIVSSGPNMLIEFTTSAFDEPNHEVPWTHVYGFELIARPRYLPITDVGSDCRMLIDGKYNQSGWISNPSFSLAPNTTCIWEFNGKPGQVLWITFAHYWIAKQEKKLHTNYCAAELTIYGSSYEKREKIGSFCDHKLLKVCVRSHRLHMGADTRPCHKNESYVTTGPRAAITQLYGESTVVKDVKFLLRYEFVDRKQKGSILADPCDRTIKSDRSEKIHSINAPRDVFLYGRGGRENVRCTWMLKGQPDEVVRINITSIGVKNSNCSEYTLPHSKDSSCHPTSRPYLTLAISEWPWMGIEVPRSCACSVESVPLYRESRGSVLAINLTIIGMGPGDDYNDFFFNATYQFIRKEKCSGDDRRLDEPAGELLLKGNDPSDCSGKPWLLTAPLGHSLLLTLPRTVLANESCASDSRLLLRQPGAEISELTVCPSADAKARVKLLWPPSFDSAWHANGEHNRKAMPVRSTDVAHLVVQWESRSESSLSLQWLRIYPPSNLSDINHYGFRESAWGPGGYSSDGLSLNQQCETLCPELHACIPSELWCDGHPHCPNGSDETISNCWLERFPWLHLVMTSVTLLILLMMTGSAIRRNRHQRSKRRDQETRRASTQESFLPSKDNHRLSAYTPDFTDMDFETTV